jgi:hypothetical protein
MNTLLFRINGEPNIFIPSKNGQTLEKVVAEGTWNNIENIRLAPNMAADLAKTVIVLKIQKMKIGIDRFHWWPVFDYQTFSDLCLGLQLDESH